MKKRIDRTLFWFKDHEGYVVDLNQLYSPLSYLLNRLLNETYQGIPIRFINIDFATLSKYQKYPAMPLGYTHYYPKNKGHLAYCGLFNVDEYGSLNLEEQPLYIWKNACENLRQAAVSMQNDELYNAVVKAEQEGIAGGLITDYKMIEVFPVINGRTYSVALWIDFEIKDMFARIKMSLNNNIEFVYDVDHSSNGSEFFLEMFKSVEVKNEVILIKGHKDVEYLPLRINIPTYILEGKV